MNDIILTFASISIDLLCINISMILTLNELKSNKKIKIKQIKRELLRISYIMNNFTFFMHE